MSVIAKPDAVPTQRDVPDIDDGAIQVTTDPFWPAISLRDLRLACRISGRTTTARLLHAATEAVIHVSDELSPWAQRQQEAGFTQLGEVPARTVNGESITVYRYRRAVYAITRALILESMRDVDTTEHGDRKADALEPQADTLWRDARWAIADIQGTQRIYAELW
ncbi:Phage head completion protein (GPL) [Edwardsiella tarda]|uniref:Head completion/stabilization protein n=1 Tax=Edwardsiella tarda ATCC 15947 = NBRC 105688 TaxID=667121 RepID=A0AC61TI44_EDWTA|nr:head completion/stabilization protein [Edwardsiella tarda]UAL56651.1 head completion/stabilization protein [Edwardsiella tarda]UCQ00295.1 head completion/stabilization protein [Edwardsiella tarda ATCC 15947 = NBRC 105688]STD27889.1 Phage head completion protein (GPL) [Edwardsiella tarda]